MSTKDLTHEAVMKALADGTPLTHEQRAAMLGLVADNQASQREADRLREENIRLRAALAEAEKAEPVAWCKPCPPEHKEDRRIFLAQDYDYSGGYGISAQKAIEHGWQPLYPRPPEPVEKAELSDDEIIAIREEHLPAQGEPFDCIAFARAVLAQGWKG